MVSAREDMVTDHRPAKQCTTRTWRKFPSGQTAKTKRGEKFQQAFHRRWCMHVHQTERCWPSMVKSKLQHCNHDTWITRSKIKIMVILMLIDQSVYNKRDGWCHCQWTPRATRTLLLAEGTAPLETICWFLRTLRSSYSVLRNQNAYADKDACACLWRFCDAEPEPMPRPLAGTWINSAEHHTVGTDGLGCPEWGKADRSKNSHV